MENKLIATVANGIKELYNASPAPGSIQLQKTRKEFEGDLTLVVFPFLKTSKKSPEQTAQDLGAYIVSNEEEVVDFNVVKGFLNLSFSSNYWLSVFDTIKNTPNFGHNLQKSGKTYMVEYSSPNTNKPLHLGHLRNNFLGYAVAEILKANGHEVFKTQIINDRGIHICKSMVAWLAYGNDETPESAGLKGDHLVGKYYVKFDQVYKSEIADLVKGGMDQKTAEKEAPIFKAAQQMLVKWEANDDEVRSLWKKMNNWVYDGFNASYQKMGVDFDELYYESDTYVLGKTVVEEGLANQSFYQKEDNSVWVALGDEKMDDKLLLRADGTSVYMTQDIGTAIERYKNHPKLNGLIYTVGNEQNHHFKVLFSILKKLGHEWANECYHLSYGMVELPEGKMKSREGTVVDADDLMQSVVNDAKQMTQERGHLEGMSEEHREQLYEQIGLGGLKYFLLKVDPKKNMLFNPQESIDLNGNTGPFIQYAYARIQSLLAKAQTLGFSESYASITPISEEQELIKLLQEYPSVIEEAGKNYSPAIIANYIFELVKAFNHFYQSVPILRESDKDQVAFRLNLSKTIGKVIASGMLLLGIAVPNKM